MPQKKLGYVRSSSIGFEKTTLSRSQGGGRCSLECSAAAQR